MSGLNCEEVVFGRTGGRPSGEAFVRLASRDEASKALDFNKQHMGSRWEQWALDLYLISWLSCYSFQFFFFSLEPLLRSCSIISIIKFDYLSVLIAV